MQAIPEDHPLRRLFAGLVEHAFYTEVGMCDPTLTGYLSELLVDFTHIDRLRAVRNARGRDLKQIAAMMLVLADDLSSDPLERDRLMYRQIGDFTLFWAGVYPEQLRYATRQAEDVLLDYVAQGKRSYAIVSDLADEEDAPPSSLFRHLSEDFEHCLYGLGLVRRGWENGTLSGGDSSPGLLY
ncbi:MAG: hypothetical protein JSU63_21420 [Phycisphaerales bacterium]|nr:MAG: hypothetical protein JSU63_21420 [Phycisphaerales bacterium]